MDHRAKRPIALSWDEIAGILIGVALVTIVVVNVIMSAVWMFGE